MRVLNTYTGQSEEIDPNKTKYAILSHTWDPEGEQTYQALLKLQKHYRSRAVRWLQVGQLATTSISSKVKHCLHGNGKLSHASTPSQPLGPIWGDRKLSPKIREACRVARENGYRYLWIDSCCIDKTSSSELSESINSMYQWYAHADVCYAFLPDVPAEEDHRKEESRFRRSRWFKRGWTLQELIAPRDVRFLSKEWTFIGSKESLADLVVEITHINHNALLNIEPLDEFSVAQRFSWAAERKTTRVEDRAYSLLGIFDINMPTLYGEGERAFRRLQEEIMRRTPDQSLFAWGDSDLVLLDRLVFLLHFRDTIATSNGQITRANIKLTPFGRESAFLIPSPDNFKHCTDITALSHAEVARRLQLRPDELSTMDYTFTPYGIRTRLPVISLSDFFPTGWIISDEPDIPISKWYLVILGCGHKQFPGHLLARPCCIETSGSSLNESLQSGRINIYHRFYFDFLHMSPATIARLRSSGRRISVKTLYIPQPERDEVGNLHIARRRRHEMIKLVLLEKTCEALSTHGYKATLRSPDDAHQCSHSVTLSHDTHTITIDYQHTLEEDEFVDQKLTIEAQITISGTSPEDTPCDLGVPPKADVAVSGVSWKTSVWWDRELDFQDVELNVPDSPIALRVRLGLTLATTNHYLLRIELKTPDGPSSPSDHNDVVQAGRSENPMDIDVTPPRLTNGGDPSGSDVGQLAGPVHVEEIEG